jgi:hypothetical protein
LTKAVRASFSAPGRRLKLEATEALLSQYKSANFSLTRRLEAEVRHLTIAIAEEAA